MRPYKLHTVEDVIVVEIATLGLMEGPELELMATHLPEELMRSRDKRMVVDCQRLRFVASAALRILVNLSHLAKQFDGGFVICGVGAQVMPVLRISGLDRHIPICGTRQEAVATLVDPPAGARAS